MGPQGPAGSPDTPEQVLAKLITVDGAGSGLDADKLGGHDASYFGTATIIVSDTAPANPIANKTLWWESDTGQMYLYYSDGDSSQWVQINGGGGGGGGSGSALVPTDDNPPTAPGDGQLWWRSNNGNLYIWYDDGNSKQWVQIGGSGGGSALVPIDDAAPASPMRGQLWWRSNLGQLYIYYDDGNSQQWVQAIPTGKAVEPYSFSAANMLLRSVNATSIALNNKADGSGKDTLTVDNLGNVTINGTGSGQLGLNKAASGQYALIRGFTATKLRWDIWMGDATAESGSNVGSDFGIARYNDAGSYLGTSLIINRASGLATLERINARQGYACQPGSGAANTSNVFNLFWKADSTLHAWVDTTDLGYINITSDYRVKKDVQPLSGMWEKVKALKPISYSQADYGELFKADDVERWGFIAHELQETLIDSAASGHKDEENVIQSPNPWTVIAALTEAFQEAMARIEALEATLDGL